MAKPSAEREVLNFSVAALRETLEWVPEHQRPKPGRLLECLEHLVELLDSGRPERARKSLLAERNAAQ